MQLNTLQLKALATLADRWLAALPAERDELSAEASAQGSDFERAFFLMIGQLNAENSPTQLPPIPDALRDAALSEAKTNHASASALDKAPPQRQSGQHVGPYRLIKEIGRGGMGVVWLAARADGQHERQVALKMPLVENLNWLLAARFARERNILASLEHPGIARLYDAGVDSETQPYIALEYVVGVPINDYVRNNALKPESTVALFTKVINAVSHAHAQLVIHRDIKPTNILVDGKGEPHLLDFGIAKLLDDEDAMSAEATQLTRLSGRALTLDYASPEQVNGQTLGTASDVYALGVVLYELLTGNKPYAPTGPTRRDLELAICEQEPAKPSDRLMLTGTSEAGKTARRIRGDLDTVVLKALKKDPRQRYATAQAFADDLKRYLAFEPITAKPDSEWYRISKFVRRNRLGMAAAVAVAIALGVGVVSTLWQAGRAEREAVRANEEARQKAAEASRANALAVEAQQQSLFAKSETKRAENALTLATVEGQRAMASARAADSSKREAQAAAIATALQRDIARRQRDEANRQSVIATSEATRADAASDFLMTAFAEAKPASADTPSPSILKVTEEAIRAARADTKMNPEVRVSLLNQLGTVLQAQGKTVEARVLLASNYADAVQRLGERHSATIAAGNALARAEMVSGDFPASRAMFDLMLSRFSAERPSVRAAILSGSGKLASKMRDPDVALRDAERGYELCQRDCREEDRIELGSEYADVLTTFGKPAQAMAIYKDLDLIVRSRFGERHVRRATLLGAMSSTARLLADVPAAVQYAREALAIDDAVLQPTDYRRALHLYFLALGLVSQREYKEATVALEQSLAIEQLALGASHPDVSYTLNAIGFIAIGMNDFTTAVRYLSDAEKISREKLSDRHTFTLTARANLAYARVLAGDAARGMTELRAAIRGLSDARGAAISDLAPALEKQAWLEIDQGDGVAAAATYDRVAALVAAAKPTPAYWKGRLVAGRAWAAYLRGEFEQASSHAELASQEFAEIKRPPPEVVIQLQLLRALLLRTGGGGADATTVSRAALDAYRALTWPSLRTQRLAAELSAKSPLP